MTSRTVINIMPPILTDGLLCVSMSLKDEKNSALNHEELIFLLAIAGRIDAQSKQLAQKLDKDRYIYHAYAILDSLSSSYSMFKYFMEVYFSRSDPDFIHTMLTSPAGIAAAILEAGFLVSFAFLASVFNNEEEDSVKKFIATAWPYFRDVIKGLKNAYKGWRSAMQSLGIISGTDLKYMVIPIGLALGVLAAANRFWLRHVVEKRKKLMHVNEELLLEILLKQSTPFNRQKDLKDIVSQKNAERIHAFFAVAASGVIDGLYLYIGVVSLSLLSPSLFLAMSAMSILYTLACVISRIYEEYDFQLRLIVTQNWCKFAIATKEIEAAYENLLSLHEKKDKDLDQIKQLTTEFFESLTKFDELRQLLKGQLTHSYLTAGLLGMKYGLFAYGVLTSFLFMAASISLITATAFPPSLLVACILSGLVLMIGMTAFTMRAHYLHLQKQKNDNNDEERHPYLQLKKMKQNIEDQNDVTLLPSSESFRASIKDGVTITPSPQFFFQEWFEVFRSMASGLSKGNNFSNFATTPLQNADADGHYHDSPVMSVLAVGSAVLFSLVLGLRALARGLGRPPKGCAIDLTKKTHTEGLSVDKKETELSEESSKHATRKPRDSLVRNVSSYSSSAHSFFGIGRRPRSLSPLSFHTHSTNTLDYHAAHTTNNKSGGLE